ncbi:hypothetical protein [Nocardioides acrostichi]|uniref:Alkaline shock response membrane anchor protein AmaP n=1 Tax=Nocardioides acrostichi TaxID=2784339 RepID=A0A930Y748_9ACTN|nr:hypothetical protein [Nocardioides acrostichi]MBF4161662.1 hypothetical protein [Nocardioides acrostichi]
MSARLSALDRFLVGLVGLVLLAGGLVVVDWRVGLAPIGLPTTLDTTALADGVASSGWPWVSAGVCVVLALLALAWILAHLGRRSVSVARSVLSDEEGRVVLDLSSVAAAAATDLADTAPVASARGWCEVRGASHLVVLRAKVLPDADVDALVDAARASAVRVVGAFEDDRVGCRVLLHGPPRLRRGLSTSLTSVNPEEIDTKEK